MTLMVVGKEAVLSVLNTVSISIPLYAACIVFQNARLSASSLDLPYALSKQADVGTKAKEAIFALLWNRGSEHFQVYYLVLSY